MKAEVKKDEKEVEKEKTEIKKDGKDSESEIPETKEIDAIKKKEKETKKLSEEEDSKTIPDKFDEPGRDKERSSKAPEKTDIEK